ncbi:hypothetical protein PAPYR_1202 [Paratrimastix pyriformis]|uniref:G domain-containing protein n=1 Tax=Paratrimastix pyriformis TaxID=342808 RepID=A0ABQ8UT84_9EUKA|nr:hypothetical protein PAPYR_1202 [Paratrimastix pyriformis]
MSRAKMEIIRIAVVGASGVGKTSFCNFLTSADVVREHIFTQHLETWQLRRTVGDKECVIRLVDSVGSSHETDEQIRTIPLLYPPEAAPPGNVPDESKNLLANDQLRAQADNEYAVQGFLVFFDLTNDRTFYEAVRLARLIHERADLKQERAVHPALELQQMQQLQCDCVDTSVRNNENVHVAIDRIVKAIRKCQSPEKEDDRCCECTIL